jgi:hypothetical protein
MTKQAFFNLYFLTVYNGGNTLMSFKVILVDGLQLRLQQEMG